MNPDPAPDAASQVALAILAGGEGRRMGAPKDRLLVRGKPILQFLVEHLAWPGPKLLILGRGRDASPGHEFCDQIVHDPIPGQGPLRGILTAIEASPRPATIIIPVDMPWLEREYLLFLVSQLAAHPSASGVLLSRATGKGPRIEPFPCAFAASAAPIIRAQIGRREFAIRSAASDPAIAVIEAPQHWPEVAWYNVNTPGDLPDWIRLDS